MLTQEMLEAANMRLTKDLSTGDPKHIELTCNVCGTIKKMSVNQIKNATEVHCRACEEFKEFEKKLEKKYGRNPYEFLTPYRSQKEEVLVRCKDCGEEFKIIPNLMLFHTNYPEGVHPCKGCTRIRARKDQIKQFYDEEIFHFGEVKHDIINERCFTGLDSSTASDFKCRACGCEFHEVPIKVVTGSTWYCPNCHPRGKQSDAKPKGVKVEFVDSKESIVKKTTPQKDRPVIKLSPKGEAPVVVPVKKKASTNQKEFKRFLYKTYNGFIVENDMSVLKDQALQYYIPALKKAIVFCDFDSYNELKVGKKLLQNTYLRCKEAGVVVIHVFEDEWQSKRKIVEDKIKHLLGLNDHEKIYARKCEIREIEDTKVKDEFLEKYHIQGKDSSAIKIGLYYKDELMSVLTFGVRRVCMGTKVVHQSEYELLRFASRTDKLIVGGFSKLLKYFIDKYDPKLITTFSDLRYSTGNLYEKNNFTFDHMTEPNYWYYKDNDTTKRWHRFNYRKQELSKKLKVFDPEKTEKDNCILNGVVPIYDAGNYFLVIDRRTEEEKKQWEEEEKAAKESKKKAKVEKIEENSQFKL